MVLVASSAFALDPTREISQCAHTMWTLQEGFLPEAPGWIASILEDRNGRIWFTQSGPGAGKGPLCKMQGERAVCHGAADGVPILNGRQLTVDAQGNLWTVSDHTLMRWNNRSARTWFPPGISAATATESIDVLQSHRSPADNSGSRLRHRSPPSRRVDSTRA